MRLVRHQTAESTPAWRSQPAARTAFSLAVAALVSGFHPAAPRAQQTATIQRDNEAFLAEPGGVRLARLTRGARFPVGGARSRFTALTLEGWVFQTSLGTVARDGHTLRVTKAGGENLREAPNATVVARLVSGALLDEVERRPGWVHVRRSGWVATAGLQSAGASRSGPGAEARRPGVAPGPARAPAAETTATNQELDPSLAVARTRLELHRAPGAPPSGSLEADMPVRVTARAGEWVRVETQAWVRERDLRPVGDAALNNVTAAELRADPERFQGRLIRWTIQFIALQTADELRPDFALGERYILARGPAPEYAFAYVVVPASKVAEVGRLAPLASVTIIARVRSGRSAYLANPILELVDIAP
jgi:hypothetical protein